MVFKAIETLGVPIVFATVLLLFFLRSNRALASQNSKLLEEVAALRQRVDTTVHAITVNERLMTQNERLVDSLRSKEEAFTELLRSVVESRSNGAGVNTHA